LIAKLFESLFGSSHEVRTQLPIVVDGDSEPEPDIAVVAGTTEDYADHHPTPPDVALLLEVSDTTLRTDRISKGALYAENGVPEFWIANLNSRQLEVYREPVPMPQAEHGFGYRSVTVLGELDIVSPQFASGAKIEVNRLLPAPDRGK
jgi:Uma2 family endonuclease